MRNHPSGHWVKMSLPRRFVCDLIYFAKQVPTVPVQRRMHLAEVVAARQTAQPRPGWCAVFTKALGVAAAARPELRRFYLKFPWPHLYQHPVNMFSIAVERQYEGENAVFFGRIGSPEEKSLQVLEEQIRRFKDAPIMEIGAFRHSLLVTRLPLPIRRLIWWFGLNVTGRKRAHKIGTCGVSSYSSLGADSLHPLSPMTVTMNYGPVDAEGYVDVRLIYDHRVMDGATVARALADMEAVLQGQILTELRKMRQDDASQGSP